MINTRKRAVTSAVLSVLVLSACRIGSSPPSPSPSASPSPSPSPSQAACPVDKSPLVLVQGCTFLRNHDSIDLDRGRVGTPSPDLTVNNGTVTVTPPAMSMYLGPTKFDALTVNLLERAHLSSNNSNYDMLLLEDKGVFAMRTGQGRPAKVLLQHVDQIAWSIDIAFVTYRGPSDSSSG